MAGSSAPGLLREFLQRGEVMLKFGCFMHCVHNYFLQITVCQGPSMLPTLNHVGDIVLTECISAHLKKIKSGDVVVATSPANPRSVVCKRVLAMEGEQVRVVSPTWGDDKIVDVPAGHVWLQGDNTRNSNDSRHYGPVPMALVQSKVVCRIWPPRGWGWIETDFPNKEFVVNSNN
uniref:Peptidase S26 domain-containing protein n=1 Tax=Pyramimonas obovata TaxID=1411642 RepID=A0A7S0WXM8_9CHLO|mmetsp:Transcript_7728/g.15767  ORF Transcript_7728/g.15767 Transcript_7728/m.15767 type:complete len:175 (+) Transcript_7728:211-735(+)|eukprot:CAMPEP_0118922350 /NCGR_PEP_ID=MMETSP1169-20130426/1306_1 /TAXON_ID=36882 /ORGANISM="Pyramimonas obovata, Strain CCMP722" /LENGTH=174 /DNA_ID=CAMNT_0006863197 /DNA_START=192 /DNA_END=716 /DNA_ORIENTATION=+